SNFYHQEIQITSEWQTMEFELKHASDSEAFEGEAGDWTLKEEFADHFVQNNWWNQWGSDPADAVYWGWETETAEEFVEQIEADPLWAESIALQWAIPNSKDGNNAFLRDTEEDITIYIDNVEITNYEPTFEDQLSEEDAWDETHGTEGDLIWDVGPTTEVGSENEYFGNAWYGYSIDDEAQLETIDEADESFSLDFVLGPPDSTVIGSGDTVEVAPFAGVAADMYTDADSTLYNATEAGFDGLRFTYSTEGVEWLQVRLYDSNEFSQDGTVFHVAVPGTNGESKTATISFDDLTLPWWNTDDQDKSFRPDEIENLAFVYQGEEAETGTISLSNVKFMSDTEKRTKDITDIIADDKITAARDNFSVDLNDMSLNIAIPEGVSEGRALLYSVKGELVKSQELNTAQNMSTLSTENIANGTYILRVVSTEGTRANFVRAISINR
ncbi:MAG: T9SS type A sorting domain-containing protein, partial [Fibrobacterota bacterium]